MSGVSMRTARASLAALAAGALVLTGCSSGGGGEGGSQDKAEQRQVDYNFGDAKESQGPAPAVKGARSGGTIQVLQRDSFAHLDPNQIYVADEGSVSTLLHRKLTDYKRDKDGNYAVVGDLATDSGKRSNGGKTWTYTLKKGVKWENGDPITSKDVRHTIERRFASFLAEGPTFIQEWLTGTSGADFRKKLPDGPYKGDHLPKDVLDTPDDRTIVFHFDKPVADLPYALAMPGYGLVPEKGDTKKKYDKAPVSSGPYKLKSFNPGKNMKLVRNTEWDPKTDATRHQYPKAFTFQFDVSYEDSTKRLISDSGENKTTVSFTNEVDASSMQTVQTDPAVKKRSIAGHQSFVTWINFNLDRMKNKKVRQAVAHAAPTQPLIAAFGGANAGEAAGNYISPTLAGFKPTDPLGKKKKPQGDLKKAKAFLKGVPKKELKLTFAYQNSPEWQQYSTALKENLEKIGFDIQRKELVTDTYLDQIGKVDNDYDMYHSNWGADWASGLTVVPNLFDGRQIQDGSANYSHYDSERTNKEIDRVKTVQDPKKAAGEWMKLSDDILKRDLPQVPLMYYKSVQLYGSKIGGAYYDGVLHGMQPTALYVKK
ncbi:ABC transporter substrate-binding protein [Streptomyces sp. AJS327]|uniref:ABC transporter substrate-binding protein n=1 Tax=Streptomyces sp. AJS327 TaxID=2545265 RepID=UPI0015DE1199|nr:ABC transporter substrate-binding protein [Streptomyces sp. AJS327]MBA0051402.1 ABC transporter substrate-binding protein [Streptomyces sp. AJS327]